MAPRKAASNGRSKLAGKSRSNSKPIVAGTTNHSLGKDIEEFVDQFREQRFTEVLEVLSTLVETKTAYNKKQKTVKLKMPSSALSGQGKAAEKALMTAFGWYWEPLLHDLAFFEEMRDSVPIIDGAVQKLVDFALLGFKIQSGDPDQQQDLENALVNDANVDLRETFRNAMTDLYSLGNCYKVPIWKRDDQGRLVPKVFRPIRANALRKLRDEDLVLEGFVQLLHRPSEFIMGTPAIPSLYDGDEIAWGIMRSKGWYAYGTPLLASLPWVVRLKMVMERDLAEMLHQHVPRIDLLFTPDDQMNQEQVDQAMSDINAAIAKLKSTDNFSHTPDVTIEYKGPQGKSLDFQGPQEHIEHQLFYVLPFAPAVMGLDSTANPFDSQERWTVSVSIADGLRTAVSRMFAPSLKRIADDWGIESITIGWQELDPTNQQELAMAEEYQVNNAALKRDNGFIDQDEAARQGTSHQKGGPVKAAAAPGKLPPPVDPNKPQPGDGPANPTASKVTNKDKGPKKDGRKVPQSDKRPAGKRHSAAMQAYQEMRDHALSLLES